jgi:AcrR family transcriptional regulator
MAEPANGAPTPVAGRVKPGSRGAQTRARLMAAAREMLKSASPIELTAVAVARGAGTAPPSFYVYFTDTRDLLLALAEEAADDLKALGRHFAGPWPPADPLAWATRFVEDFVATWSLHNEVLATRNLEADRGDVAFDESRVQSCLPVLNGLTDRMVEVRPEETRRVDVFAEAVIFYATLERIASITGHTPDYRLQPKHYKAAMARMIARAVTEG